MEPGGRNRWQSVANEQQVEAAIAALHDDAASAEETAFNSQKTAPALRVRVRNLPHSAHRSRLPAVEPLPDSVTRTRRGLRTDGV